MKIIKGICYLSSLSIVMFFLMAAGHAGAQQSTPKEYNMGAGDVLQIEVWNHADLKRTVEVGRDGTFTFPFIGQVQASGKSISTLEKLIIQKLSDGYLVGPQVTVSILEYKNKKVFLFGEVNHPGSYIFKQNMRLLELVSDAGGFTGNRGKNCTIIRASESNQNAQPVAIEDAFEHEVITVDLTRLTKGDYSLNKLINPNDSIYVSTAEHIFVTGEVKTPGEVDFTEGMTVRQAISMAGGGTPKASLKRTQITRMSNGKEIEIKPDLGDILSPNDIIRVPESFF